MATIPYSEFIKLPGWLDLVVRNYQRTWPLFTDTALADQGLDDDNDGFQRHGFWVLNELHDSHVSDDVQVVIINHLVHQFNDAQLAYDFIISKHRIRWPEVEDIIIGDPDVAGRYAVNVIRGRWPEAEGIISRNVLAASLYAYNIIRGRWPEAEGIISQDRICARWYAMFIIEGRWPEGEEAIKRDPVGYQHYLNDYSPA